MGEKKREKERKSPSAHHFLLPLTMFFFRSSYTISIAYNIMELNAPFSSYGDICSLLLQGRAYVLPKEANSERNWKKL